ncbi:MAG TPA: hydantoinase B/oxoprolinase family protein [Solirubrobacterales bacterium]|nr:hydantoinase B/oxoprolinase family protein [Solirubrobacterales bacterium]
MSARLDPVTLQVMLGGLRAVCEEMGAVLVRAAHSANIKERRDASTALFDAQGQMVMQAEHIPVHLGAMPDAVAAVLHEEHAAGDTWIMNDPYHGGTHLPDITLVSPLFRGTRHVGFAATRAHHADVGGEVPGSMPARSRRLAQEGVVIPPTRLARDWEVHPGTLDSLVAAMRGPRQRAADLRAQLAANRLAARRMGELADRHGDETLDRAMDEVLLYAERRTRASIAEMPDGRYHASDVLEDDAAGAAHDLRIECEVRISGEELTVDFAGTAPQTDGNLNCPLSVTKSAVYYVVRVLTDPDLPPSAGAYRPVHVSAPPGTVLNAQPPAAVAGGNVETSSRIADVTMAALGQAVPAPAAGQGTMNNLTLGNERFTYYETLGGGQGACPDADGPSAVHVAMSNTLNTPIEALEAEFPLRVREYAVRRGSGGAGRHAGGAGVVREVEALEPMTFSLLTERRRVPPPGAAGGGPGSPGRNILLRAGEAPLVLPSKAEGELRPGDRLRLETPGGGGHGAGP